MLLQEFKQTCEKLKPIIGRKADGLFYAYVFEKELDRKRALESYAEMLLMKHLDQEIGNEKILLPPPSSETSNGDFSIGSVIYNGKEIHPFCIRSKNMIKHMAVFGSSGTGKTNLIYGLIKNGLIKNKVPFLIFDWKRNYRDMLTDVISEDVVLYTVGRDVSPFRFNPLIPPPGVDPKIYLPKLIEIISHAFFLGEGVMYILLKGIDEIYEKFGVYKGNPQRYPTMNDVLEWLASYKAKGREMLWYQSTIRAIASINFGEMGKVVNTDSGVELADLLNKQVILELDSLSNTNKIFIIEAILLWIHHYRLGDGKREVLKHVIIVEEAHHIMLKQKQEVTSGETIVDIIVREIRELGESLVMIDQMPSQFSLTGLANSFTTISFNLKTHPDVRAIADAMLMKPEERDFLGRLEVGNAIVKMQGGWFKPFLIKVPLIEIQKGSITDESLKEAMKGRNSAFSPAVSRDSGISAEKKEIQRPDKSLSSEEMEYLKYVLQHPLNGTVRRYSRMGMSHGMGNDCKESLLKKGMIEPLNVSTKTGRVVLVQLTEFGKKELQRMGFETSRALRYGGLIHEFWCETMAVRFEEQGYSVRKECPIGGGKTVDLVVEKDDKRIAVEVETGNSDAIGNIEKCANTGYKEILSLSTNQNTVDSLKRSLSGKNFAAGVNIRVLHVKDY